MEQIETKPEETIEEKPKAGFPERLKVHRFKVLAGMLGILVLTGAVFAGYKFAQIQQRREERRIKTKQIEMTQCEQDSDCVLAVRLDACCSCPEAILREAVQKDENWVKYEFGKDYSKEKEVDCQGVSCQECALWNKAVCESGKCKAIFEEESWPPTATWKTYTDISYGYSIKYPPDWERGIEIASFIKDGYSLTIGPTPLELSRPPGITITTKKVKVGDRDYLKEIWRYPDGRVAFERINLKEIKVEGSNFEIVLMHKNGVYSKEHEQIFNLMLSTFRFLDKKAFDVVRLRGSRKYRENLPCSTQRIYQCGDKLKLVSSCSDDFDVILDKDGNFLSYCGGLKGYSEECKKLVKCTPDEIKKELCRSLISY